MSRLEDRRDARDGLKTLSGRQPVVAALDLGASKVACFIMKPDAINRDLRTLTTIGVGQAQSRGVRGGAIVNMEDAADAIAQAVERAEAVAGAGVHGVSVTTSGGQLASNRVTAQVSLGARPIDDHDLSRAIAAALAQVRMPGRRPIHLLPIGWSVDAQRGIRDPRSMFGRVLGLELVVVSISETVFQTLSFCVERAHLEFHGVVAAPFSAALAALEDDEMDLGCVCVDMGGGSTSVAVFANGALIHVDSLAVGGAHVTADIARGLSTSIAGAERIKTLHGSAIASANEDREMIEAPPRGDDPGAGPVIAPRSLLKGIIAPRVEETLELLRERLKASGAPLEPGAGIVLTGGASQLAGVREVAVRVFDRPVRLGRPRRAPHLADAASGPAFCAAAGVLQRAAFGPREVVSLRALAGVKPTPTRDDRATPIGRIANWLRDNL
ncbi:MAG TPA: cell division protein FtsA [Caulobacteraceae bacterium]|jgi:cell division protein FtsA|nr:cell division protein FtsA [Caulobacteraceae bacterium]